MSGGGGGEEGVVLVRLLRAESSELARTFGRRDETKNAAEAIATAPSEGMASFCSLHLLVATDAQAHRLVDGVKHQQEKEAADSNGKRLIRLGRKSCR